MISTLGKAVSIFLIGILTGLWFGNKASAPIGEAVEMKPVAELKGVATETRPCTPVIVYKEAAKKKLKLPQPIQDDSKKSVTSSVGLKPDLYPHRITSILNTETGETITYDQKLDAPWLASSRRGEAGIIYGQNQDGRALRLVARQSFLEVKTAQVSGHASYDHSFSGGKGTYLIGIQLMQQW